MRKYKIGDRVRLINKDVKHDWNCFLHISSVYKVTGYHGRGEGYMGERHPTVRLDLGKHGYWWVYIGSVEPAGDGQMLFPFMYEEEYA